MPGQLNWASRPWVAASTKFDAASSKGMWSAMLPCSSTTARISPNQNAALATSSIGVGPEGRMRFSIRMWAWRLPSAPMAVP